MDISLGTSEGDPIPVDGAMPSGTSGDLTSLLKSGGALMDNSVAISRDSAGRQTRTRIPSWRRTCTASLASVRSILLEEVEKGDGALHALIYDPQARRQTRRLLDEARRRRGTGWTAR